MSITMDEFDFDQEREAETIIHNSERKEAKMEVDWAGEREGRRGSASYH